MQSRGESSNGLYTKAAAVRADLPLNKVLDKQTFTANEVHECIFGVAWLWQTSLTYMRGHRECYQLTEQ